jgi:hypothetical protein
MSAVSYQKLREEAKGCVKCKRKPTRGEAVFLSFMRNENSPYAKQLSATPKGDLLDAVKHGDWYCYICMAVEKNSRRLKAMSKEEHKKEAEDEERYRVILKEKFKRGKCAGCKLSVTDENYCAFYFIRRDGPRQHSMWNMIHSGATKKDLKDELAACDMFDCECWEMRKRFNT